MFQRKGTGFGVRNTGVSVLPLPGILPDPWADTFPSLDFIYIIETIKARSSNGLKTRIRYIQAFLKI